jgi:hypothetical protein
MPESKSGALPLGYAPTRPGAPRIAAASAEFNETLRERPTVPALHLALAATDWRRMLGFITLSEMWMFQTSGVPC